MKQSKTDTIVHTLMSLMLALLGVAVLAHVAVQLWNSQPPDNAIRLPLEPARYALCPDQVRCAVWSGYYYGEPAQYYQCSDGADGFAHRDEHVCDNREAQHGNPN